MSSPAASEEYWRQNAVGPLGNFFGNAWQGTKDFFGNIFSSEVYVGKAKPIVIRSGDSGEPDSALRKVVANNGPQGAQEYINRLPNPLTRAAAQVELAVLKKEAEQVAQEIKQKAIDNYDKKTNSTTIDGVTIKFVDKGLADLKAGQAALWSNFAKAAKEAGVTEITIGSVERSSGTHMSGYSADVRNVRFAGESSVTAYNLKNVPGKREAFAAFENAFMRQFGAEAAWTPNQMLSAGNSSQVYIPKYYAGSATGGNQLHDYPQILAQAVDIKRQGKDVAFDIEKLLIKKFPTIDKNMYAPLAGSVQHADHGHFQVTRPY